MANWQQNTDSFQRIKMGSPSSYWSYGLNKRLQLVQKYLDFDHKKILDMGCGLGEFMIHFNKLGAESFGIEVDPEKVALIKDAEIKSHVQVAPAERLPFSEETFDLVFSHEVLEHVNDDRQAIAEALRVLKPGGKFIIFCPNIRWPFETHGIYLGKKYLFGNIPLVTYLPRFIYKKLTPHVRNYSNKDLLGLFPKNSVKIIVHRHVFPGFDGLVAKLGLFGKIIRMFLNVYEKSPLHYFGISHFLIVEKT
jgi:SAM-dependent methyltransferase